MLDDLDKWLGILVVGIGAIGSYFNLKSDSRSQAERIARLEKERTKTDKNAQDIRELQLQHVATKEHREGLNKLLEKIDNRMERQDEKMDAMLKAITQVDTKLQERTKELHS